MVRAGPLPKWLYETLPYVYIVGGISTAGVLQNIVATISGVLLLSAGALVLTMRHNYRSSRREADEVLLRHNGERNGERNGDEGSGLLQVGWRPAFDIGHEVIDRQHRNLVSLGNQFISALMQGSPREDLDLMLDVLVAELGRHLKLEEDLAAGHGTPLPGSVVQAHRSLWTRAAELRDRFQGGQLAAGDLVGFIAYDLVVMHVVREDLRLPIPQRARPPADSSAGARRGAAETANTF